MKAFRATLITTLFLSLLHMAQARAAFSKIECHTPRMKKSFVISARTVTFLGDNESGRKLASITASRTKRRGNGFTKILHYWGEKHIITIADKNNLNELDDSLTIRSAKGHEMTYPLSCSRR